MAGANRRRVGVPGRIRREAGYFGVVLLCAVHSIASSARAESQEAGKRGGAETVAPDASATDGPRTGAGAAGPGLDDLLRLPSDFKPKSEGPPVAGASEEEWKRRFSRADKAIIEARETLAATRRELDGLAENGGSSQWSVAPPGAQGQQSTSPLSFKLRQQLQRNREALDTAEKALRELRIEADLAGVPAGWRVVAASPPPAPPSPSKPH
jgi:hypothetical protein